MTARLSGPMLAPRSGAAPRQAVVLLHGYGSDGNDLIALGPHIHSVLPDALIVSPHAPEPCPANPSGYQWFALDYAGDRLASRQAGLPLARPVLVRFLNDLWKETGLTPADTVLSGFSQGAMMALHAGFALDTALMGILAFSGAFVPPEGFGPTAPKPPVCLVHGDMDSVVDPQASALAERELAGIGVDVRHHVSRGTAHGIAPDGLAFGLDFLEAISTRR